MGSLKPNHDSKQQQTHNLHRHGSTNLQTLWSNVTHRIPKFSSSSSVSNPNPFCSLTSSFSSYFLNYLWKKNQPLSTAEMKNQSLSTDEIKKRMVGIPIYKISNYSYDAYALVSDDDKDRNIRFYFINKGDAEDLLHKRMLARPNNSAGWQIFDAPLSHVVRFEGLVPPVRLVPESSQVKNAINEERKKAMGNFSAERFSGVPVFQSDYLTMTDPNTKKVYRPAYLRKEDLEKAMAAFVEPKHRHAVQVAALEDIIQEMKDSSISKSNDVLFVGPGITSWTWYSEHQP